MPRRLPLALYLGSLCILSLFLWRAGWARTWSALQVPAMMPIFADMRVIQAATELSRHGIDPQTHSLEPISVFPMNYPSIWIGIGEVLNLPAESHFLVVCALVLLSFVGVGCFLLYRFPSYGLLACLLSTATLLGMERGNCDLVVFCLVFAFVIALPRNWSLVPLLLAIALKLYPVFAIAGYLIGRRYRILLFAVAAASVVFILYRHELAGIRAVTLQGSSFVISYGFPSLADYFVERRLSLWYFGLLVAIIGATTIFLTLILFRRPALGAAGRTDIRFIRRGRLDLRRYLHSVVELGLPADLSRSLCAVSNGGFRPLRPVSRGARHHRNERTAAPSIGRCRARRGLAFEDRSVCRPWFVSGFMVAAVVAWAVSRAQRSIGSAAVALSPYRNHEFTFIGVTFSASRWSPMALAMKRAVIGVPS